jgi:hypothetical protein
MCIFLFLRDNAKQFYLLHFFDNPIEVIEQQEKFIEYLTIKVEKLQREKAKLIKMLNQQEISLTSRKI